MEKREHINELNVIRALGIIAVVLIHVTANPIVNLERTSSFYFLYNFLNVFSVFAVPTFIFLSGFVLLYNYYVKQITKELIVTFYKKRALYILLPYIIFSVLYFILTLVQSRPDDWSQLLPYFLKRMFIEGKTYYHLYYLYILAQFYLIFPVLLWALKKRWISQNAIIFGFIIQWLFILLNYTFRIIPDKSILFLTYLSYFFIGAYFGIYYEKWGDFLKVEKRRIFSKLGFAWMILWGTWGISGISYILLLYFSRIGKPIMVDTLVYEGLYNWFTASSAVVLFQLSIWLYKKLSPNLLNRLIHIGITSFGIYLIHPFYLTVITRFIPVSSNAVLYHIEIFLFFLLVFALSWGTTHFMMRYIKGSWIMVGSYPKTNPYKAVQVEERNQGLRI